MCNLREIVKIKKKYGAYLWLDEAHSIGAMGPTGRGVCEQLGVDTQDVDVMMGTFNKVIRWCRWIYCILQRNHSNHTYHLLHESLFPCLCLLSPHNMSYGFWGELMATNSAPSAISGERKIRNLRRNSIYFRQRLIDMGLVIYGDDGSPIIPIMIYSPGKIASFSRECLARGLAVVVVGIPRHTSYFIPSSHLRFGCSYKTRS